jgi:hypothetical protein
LNKLSMNYTNIIFLSRVTDSAKACPKLEVSAKFNYSTYSFWGCIHNASIYS